MFQTIFLTFSLLTSIVRSSNTLDFNQAVSQHLLATHTISLENRYQDKWVSNVFKDNILLNIAYLKGSVKNSQNVNWNEIEKPFHYEMSLEPGSIFAFHEDVLPQYQSKVSKTTNSHFNFSEGYKSDGWLIGDGVCHLASLINWVAKDAKLDVVSPINHDFMPIPEIPKEFGVSIYNYPGRYGSNSLQNLYIRNNLEKDVVFVFDYNGWDLKVSVLER